MSLDGSLIRMEVGYIGSGWSCVPHAGASSQTSDSVRWIGFAILSTHWHDHPFPVCPAFWRRHVKRPHRPLPRRHPRQAGQHRRRRLRQPPPHRSGARRRCAQAVRRPLGPWRPSRRRRRRRRLQQVRKRRATAAEHFVLTRFLSGQSFLSASIVNFSRDYPQR